MTHKKKKNKALGDKEIKEALEATGGIIKYAAKRLNVSRMTLYRYFKRKPEKWEPFREEVKEDCLDEAENSLIQKIKEKDITAIIFYLKTKGKHRGYTENQKVELNHSLDARKSIPIVVNKNMDDKTAMKAYTDLIKKFNNHYNNQK